MTLFQMIRINLRAFRRTYIKHGPSASAIARTMPFMVASGTISQFPRKTKWWMW